MWEISCTLVNARHRLWNCESQDIVVNGSYCISSNNSRGQFFFFFSHQRGAIIRGKAIISKLYCSLEVCPKYFEMKKNFTSNKLNMGFSCVPNMVPWLIFNVNTLVVRAWITTDQFCWITERRWRKGWGGGGNYRYVREAIILNIPSKGRQLIEGGLLFKEIW